MFIKQKSSQDYNLISSESGGEVLTVTVSVPIYILSMCTKYSPDKLICM